MSLPFGLNYGAICTVDADRRRVLALKRGNYTAQERRKGPLRVGEPTPTSGRAGSGTSRLQSSSRPPFRRGPERDARSRSAECEGSGAKCQAEFTRNISPRNRGPRSCAAPVRALADVGADQFETRPRRVENGGKTAVGGVLRRILDRAAELLGLHERRVDIVDLKVDRPGGGRALRLEGGCVHDPCLHRLALAEGRVAELLRVAGRVRVPAEDVAVEADALVVVARLQLEPRRGAGLAPDLEAVNLARLPRADPRSAGITDHREAAVLGDVHRLHVDLAAVGARRLDRAVGVVGH